MIHQNLAKIQQKSLWKVKFASLNRYYKSTSPQVFLIDFVNTLGPSFRKTALIGYFS